MVLGTLNNDIFFVGVLRTRFFFKRLESFECSKHICNGGRIEGYATGAAACPGHQERGE